ncbi:MAG: sialate O-acetylesterase [Rubritalea sp.]
MADLKPAPIFTDNMVIQRETQAPVWGWADAGEKVTVTGSWGESATTLTGEDGKWMVKLQTPKAGGPHTISFKGGNTVEVKNVLSGEVWFCSGQSNMDFTMSMLVKTRPGKTKDADVLAAEYIKKEISIAKDDLFRQFTVEKNTSPLEQLDAFAGSWIVSAPEANVKFSATAYFFGRELRKQLNVPVALIKCAWGGTKVEPWIPAEAFKEDKEMAAYFESNMSDYQTKLAKWDAAVKKAKSQPEAQQVKTGKKKRKVGKPIHPAGNQQHPSTLFNAMVNPVIPYAIKGAIWYQGESNAKHNTAKYEHNFRAMISAWRKHWGQGDFPFYFAQLASFRNPSKEPVDYDGWASITDQQRRTLGLQNTGMAVLSDIGEAKDIHPHNKIDAGKRLALWALKYDYNQKVPAWSGPLYQGHQIKDDKVVIKFDSVGSGLMSGVKDGLKDTKETKEPLRHFQICGKDRQWKWAVAEITGRDTITVSHPDVPAPVVVRYAWAQNAEAANLYNNEGLPASIFTTELEIPVK